MGTPPDFLLHNARIHTVDNQHPRASALAVRDGRFVAVGDAGELARTYPNAPRLDAKGRTVIPGFIDAHAHLQELGLSLHRADLTATSSPAAVVERLNDFVADHDLPDGTWLRGHGWDQTNWTVPHSPTRQDLDSAFPERPIWLTRTDVHAGWANTAALEATVGIDRLHAMTNPEGGHIRRDTQGRPTGVLVDAAMALVEDHIPPPSEATQEQALNTALQHTAQHGITGLHDAGVDLDTIRRYQRFIEADQFPLRVYAMIDGRGEAFDHFCDEGPVRHPSGRLDVASVKFFADGALGSRGAALLDDYADDSGNRGLLLQSEADLRRDVQAAVECGFQVNTHAIGDRANQIVLDAYKEVLQSCTAPVRRPRIEHAQVVAPGDRSRFGALGVIASVQPVFAPSDEEWAPARLGSPRLDRAYAWRSLQGAGASLAFGSDAPVEPIDPILGFHAAVTRQNTADPLKNDRPLSEEVSRRTALHAYTRGAAYAGFQEDRLGSITPGKWADFAVLSQDLLTVPTSQLLDTEVLATYLAGHPVYAQDAHWHPTV